MRVHHKESLFMDSYGTNVPQNDGSENGRSMVEMLGVLAIIGVLSVAGIAGYRQAMNMHKLNQVKNYINMAFVDYIAMSCGAADKTVEFGNDVSADYQKMCTYSNNAVSVYIPWQGHLSENDILELRDHIHQTLKSNGLLSDHGEDDDGFMTVVVENLHFNTDSTGEWGYQSDITGGADVDSYLLVGAVHAA